MDDVDNDLPQATNEESKTIKAISKDNVHKICSGQVVLSLAVAVKELVENSLDAGATLVEVKLVQQGLESIEVSDNGSGVEEKNLEGMTAKYHTSKLIDFIDLQTVATFGFRGEALSSLCALADITITTRHKTTNIATKIELDHEGKIKSHQHCARGEGTTVKLCNLFETLPVRRRDFVKNVKKEFNKMCQILQAYCLVSKGVRIICSNHAAKGYKTIVMQTNGSNSLLENISAVFGSRQTTDILEIHNPLKDNNDVVKEEATLLQELQAELGESLELKRDDIAQLLSCSLQLEGYISSCAHGSGRASKDRQFFYVNSRPCDPKNISKAVNDVYHRYNVSQVPFVYLNIITDRQSVDVNLTPDKRQLLINNEKVLLALIKKALAATFVGIPSTYKMQNTTLMDIINKSQSKLYPDANETIKDEEDKVPDTSTQKFVNVLSQWKRTGSTEGPIPQSGACKRKIKNEISVKNLKMQKIQEFLTAGEPKKYEFNEFTLDESSLYSAPVKEISGDEEYDIKNVDISLHFNTQNNGDFNEIVSNVINTPAIGNDYLDLSGQMQTAVTPKTEIALIELDDDDSDIDLPRLKCNELRASLSEIELMLKAEENLLKESQTRSKLNRLRFKCEINPNKNQSAEEELQKEITKSHFAQMEILGQFNLGFIIAKLDSDIFIVDQHATDEKYNFETLQKTTQLQHQPLAVPQSLELTAVNEMILLDHLHVFEKNGFKFDIDMDAPTTKKVRLLGKPLSKNWEFGKEDIDELIFMLQDAPEGTMCRPSRIRSMFASRACRKSVMIGQSLKKSTMETLLRHMGEIEQPWNCPHGRPTMRHLINIAMLIGDEEDENSNEDQQSTSSF